MIRIIAAMLLAAAAGPNVETAKQVLTKRWMDLRPEWSAERNVLFEDVRLTGQSNGSWTYRVTATVRDYDKGYPPNRYYGRTCVGRFDNIEFTVWTDGSQWKADGMFTANSTQCKPNRAAGVTSIPLASLAGTPASNLAVAAPPAPQRSGGGPVQGAYECWANGQARMLLNFSIQAGGRYLDSSGTAGTFTFDGSNSAIAFHGGMLESGIPAGYRTIYYEPHGRPTVSIRNRGGDEVAFCQKR